MQLAGSKIFEKALSFVVRILGEKFLVEGRRTAKVSSDKLKMSSRGADLCGDAKSSYCILH